MGYEPRVFRFKETSVLLSSLSKVITLPMKVNEQTGDVIEFAVIQEEDYQSWIFKCCE